MSETKLRAKDVNGNDVEFDVCESAKECLDNNGFGKAYVQSELYKALEQTNPKPSGRSSEGKNNEQRHA